MMTTAPMPLRDRRLRARAGGVARPAALALLMLLCGTQTFAQTAGGTQIQNRASATYSDGTTTYSTVSNTVTVTVANVSGLQITPDDAQRPGVVAGQLARFAFTVSNTGNYTDQVRFLANNASLRVTGNAVLEQFFIDRGAPNGQFEAGVDTQLFNQTSDVLSGDIAAGGSITVVAIVRVNSAAANGDRIDVRLGDASADNVAANNSANEVRTISTPTNGTPVNGAREAVGSSYLLVENDAQLRLNLTAPAGPVALGSTINYSWQLCNPGARAAQGLTLGGVSGVFIVAPVPVNTVLAAAPSAPAGGSLLYTTSPLTVAPTAATWTNAPPADLTQVRRVAYNLGATLANDPTVCAAPVQLSIRITAQDATTPIAEIGDAFARNDLGVQITDQSGDAVSNGGDGNADFEEDDANGSTGPQFDGAQQRTLLLAVGGVLLGTNNSPAAVGPTTDPAAALYRRDDYTNKSVVDGIATIAPGGLTTAQNVIVFTNTVRNDGNATDTIVFSIPTIATGISKVEISTDNGATYRQLVPGGNTASLTLARNSEANVFVRVTAPAGLEVLRGYDVIVRATSTNTPAATNETIDRLYTGFLRLEKSSFVYNTTGVGRQSTMTSEGDAVPGAEIEYRILYTNVSAGGGGAGSVNLTASAIRITEDGNAAPNTWGASTDQVVGSASDTRSGTITGDAAGSVLLVDQPPALGAGDSGTFKFRRRIR